MQDKLLSLLTGLLFGCVFSVIKTKRGKNRKEKHLTKKTKQGKRKKNIHKAFEKCAIETNSVKC